MRALVCLPALVLLASACSPSADRSSAAPASPGYTVLTSQSRTHGPSDDLLTAGLGREGLIAAAPELTSPDDPHQLRRLAIYHGWHAVAQLRGQAGSLNLLAQLPAVAGTEVSALLQLQDRQQPFRVLVQLPEQSENDCLVVAPASGSRGVFGAIALAGPWALPRGCAVAYTDKGLGSDIAFAEQASSTGLDGRRVRIDGNTVALAPRISAPAQLALKHAHSGDHPEADWGRHTLAAVDFALQQMASDHEHTRVIALGVSNGGGAVLRAAEQDRHGLIDAVVALSPNITAPGQPPLYDYASQAALLQPCLLADPSRLADMTLGNPATIGLGAQRCQALHAAGLIAEATPQAARAALLETGFDNPSLSQSAVNSLIDVWRMVGVTYASAYLRRAAGEMPCGYGFEVAEMDARQRTKLWAEFSGIAPGSGIRLRDDLASNGQGPLAGLRCLRSLWTQQSDAGAQLRQSVAQTVAGARLPDIPVLVIHGREDGLIPLALSAQPYVEQASQAGARISLQVLTPAQHFDTLLAAPGLSQAFIPLLPYAWQGMDEIAKVLDGDAALLASGTIEARPPAAGETLGEEHLNWPSGSGRP